LESNDVLAQFLFLKCVCCYCLWLHMIVVPVGCISRSRSQKIGFQNAIFKNLLVRNYKAQSLQIWYIASSRPIVWPRDLLMHGRWTTDNGPSQKLTLSTLCSGELKIGRKVVLWFILWCHILKCDKVCHFTVLLQMSLSVTVYVP